MDERFTIRQLQQKIMYRIGDDILVNEVAVLSSFEYSDCSVYIGTVRADASFGMEHDVDISKQLVDCLFSLLSA